MGCRRHEPEGHPAWRHGRPRRRRCWAGGQRRPASTAAAAPAGACRAPRTSPLNYSSACFDLVDYEPKASQYVKVSVSRSKVAWTGLPGDPPTASVRTRTQPERRRRLLLPRRLVGSAQRVRTAARGQSARSARATFRLYLKREAGPQGVQVVLHLREVHADGGRHLRWQLRARLERRRGDVLPLRHHTGRSATGPGHRGRGRPASRCRPTRRRRSRPR